MLGTLGKGVTRFSAPVTIDRQRTNVVIGPPYTAGSNQYPGGELAGVDQFTTVLQFAGSVTNEFIKSANYSGSPSYYWNDGSPNAVLCPVVRDLSIDGQAGYVGYPYSVSGAHGRDLPWRANAVAIRGSGATLQRLRFYQIPGWAILLGGSTTTQSGNYGMWDNQVVALDDIFISQSYAGISCGINDARIRNTTIVNVANTALEITGPGTYLRDVHTYGAQTGALISTQVVVSDCYIEAAYTGTVLTAGATGSRINGLHIGPATISGTCVSLGASNVQLEGLQGDVATTATGVLVDETTSQNRIVGNLTSSGIGALLAGNRQTVYLDGNASAGSFVKLAYNSGNGQILHNSDVYLSCYSAAGATVLDLSDTQLDKSWQYGSNLNFFIKHTGSGVVVAYPGYKPGVGGGANYNPTNAYNIYPGHGTAIYVNGVLQS